MALKIGWMSATPASGAQHHGADSPAVAGTWNRRRLLPLFVSSLFLEMNHD